MVAKGLNILLFLKILIGCHQSPKRERLKVHLGPLVGFG
jgi:hypothetical protein